MVASASTSANALNNEHQDQVTSATTSAKTLNIEVHVTADKPSAKTIEDQVTSAAVHQVLRH